MEIELLMCCLLCDSSSLATGSYKVALSGPDNHRGVSTNHTGKATGT